MAAYFKLIIQGWKFPQMYCVAQLLMVLATHTGQTAVFKTVIPGNIDTKVHVGMLLIQISRTHKNQLSQIKSKVAFPSFHLALQKE